MSRGAPPVPSKSVYICQGWDEEPHLRQCLSLCNLPDSLIDQQDFLTPEAENYFASNQQAMFKCGHWGVPLCSWGGGPF